MINNNSAIGIFSSIHGQISGYHDGQRWYVRPHPSPIIVYGPPLTSYVLTQSTWFEYVHYVLLCNTQELMSNELVFEQGVDTKLWCTENQWINRGVCAETLTVVNLAEQLQIFIIHIDFLNIWKGRPTAILYNFVVANAMATFVPRR